MVEPENIFVQSSGTLIGVGSPGANLVILMGISGTSAFPVMVNEVGALVTA